MDEALEELLRTAEVRPGEPLTQLVAARALARGGRPRPARDALRRAARAGALDEDADALRRSLLQANQVRADELRERIGLALALPGPYPAPPDADVCELHGGVEDAQGRVAWVEETRRGPDDGRRLVEARIVLRVAGRGQLLLEWDLAHYNPYFGISLFRVDWWEERVLLLYREKHDVLLALVPLAGTPALVEVDEPFLALDDLVLFVSQEPDLLEAVALPGLEARLPLPLGGRPEREELELARDDDQLHLGEALPLRLPGPRQRGFPPDPDAFRAALLTATFGPRPPQPASDLLLGALAYPFWLDLHLRSSEYQRMARRWNSPHWLPVHWHRHLVGAGRTREAAAFLDLLQGLAARAAPARGWDPAWSFEAGAVHLARGHVERRAAALLAACRADRLPPRTWCHFWTAWSRQALAPDLPRFPAGFGQVVAEVGAAGPRELRS